MNTFDEFVKKHTTVLENEYVAGALILFLIVYANKTALTLPSYMLKLFENQFFKFLMFFLIVYMYSKKPTVALISALALIIAIMILEKLHPEKKEKMTILQNGSNNELLENLKNLLNNAFKTVNSTEGQVVVEETAKAVEEGHLHPADAEMIINKVIYAEEKGMSPLIAMSEEGAHEMMNIVKNVENGNISEEHGHRMAAQIVIQENVVNIGQEVSNLPNVNQEKQMLAKEVLKQQINIENKTKTKMTKNELKQLCSQVENDYYNQKMEEMSNITGSVDFGGFDDFAPLYEEL